MKSTKIILSLPQPMHAKLMQEMQKCSYTTVQQLIVQILRDSLYAGKEGTKNAAATGRPRKIDESRLLSRQKIFDKKGKIVSV